MKILLILSGGLDSSTLGYLLKAEGHEVSAITFDYGQTHRREILAAVTIASRLGIHHEVIRLRDVFAASALTGDKEMPEGEYSLESMKQTIVPNRNMVMVSIAVSKALQLGFDAVAYGAHAGDAEVYPDCREDFVAALRRAVSLCDWSKIELLAPFIGKEKREIAQLAKKLDVPISLTWSCYNGGDEPCGVCGACRSRKEAGA